MEQGRRTGHRRILEMESTTLRPIVVTAVEKRLLERLRQLQRDGQPKTIIIQVKPGKNKSITWQRAGKVEG